MMDAVTYNDLVSRFGSDRADQLLRMMENLAEIRDEIIGLDTNARFSRALDALNDIDFSKREEAVSEIGVEQ